MDYDETTGGLAKPHSVLAFAIGAEDTGTLQLQLQGPEVLSLRKGGTTIEITIIK